MIKDTLAAIDALPENCNVFYLKYYNDFKQFSTTGDLQKLAAELTRLRQRREVLEQVGTKIMKMWFHVEAFDDGDRGWKELGDELEQALKESKDETR